jgi:hypothetical protein
MPPTPAKFMGPSELSSGGVWYELHDEDGGVVVGDAGHADLEIGLERVGAGYVMCDDVCVRVHVYVLF